MMGEKKRILLSPLSLLVTFHTSKQPKAPSATSLKVGPLPIIPLSLSLCGSSLPGGRRPFGAVKNGLAASCGTHKGQ